jgi:Holliday junction DNA helicase RuvA
LIGYLQGKLIETRDDSILINVGGVGYLVFLSKTQLAALGRPGCDCEYQIETIVREDSLSLYGFTSSLEQRVFRLLISVSGIGPKQALQILSNSTPQAVALAISDLDTGFLESMRGIGRKTAEKIILELKKPMAKLLQDLPPSTAPEQAESNLRRDLVLALTQLGYRRPQIDDAIAKLAQQPTTLEQGIKECLSALANIKGGAARL